MRYLTALVGLLLFVALAQGRAPQAPRPPQAPTAPYCDCHITGDCICGVCTCVGGKPAPKRRTFSAEELRWQADGWQYDATRNVWWKYQAAPATYYQPTPVFTMPSFGGGFRGSFGGGGGRGGC